MGILGVTHILRVDGYSHKIVGMVTTPVKNAITIYHTLLRPLLTTEGLWDKIRMDNGIKLATIPTHLSSYCCHSSRPPLLRKSSSHNLRVDKLRLEVYQRINCPVKQVAVAMGSTGEMNMGDSPIRFCVSWVTIVVMHLSRPWDHVDFRIA